MENQDLRSYLPSKKVGILAAAICVGFVAFIAVNNFQSISGIFDQSKQNNATESQSIASQQRIDEDDDGLSNWQEKLWGTDSNDPDTDGDGTPDGEEVRQNRDPTIAGPGDSLEASINDQESATSSENITSNIGQQVLPKAVVLAAAEQTGEDISEGDLERISESIANNADLENLELSDSSELTIIDNSSPDTVDSYFNQVNQTLQKVNNTDQVSPLTVVAQAQQESNPDSIDLSSYILRHNQVVNKLKEMSVPRPFQGFHLQSLQTMERKLYALRRMNSLASDPVGAVIGVRQYKKARESDLEAVKILNNEIKSYAQRVQ